jgi:hypothetical protein
VRAQPQQSSGAARSGRLFTDAEAGENPPQQIISGEFTGDLAQSLLRPAKLLGDELAGAALLELAVRLVDIAAGTRK